MLLKRGRSLIAGAIFPIQDVGHCQGENALRSFFERAVEDLVHFMLSDEARSCNAEQPEQGDTESEAERQAFL